MIEIDQVHILFTAIYVYIGHSIACGVRHLVNDIDLICGAVRNSPTAKIWVS